MIKRAKSSSIDIPMKNYSIKKNMPLTKQNHQLLRESNRISLARMTDFTTAANKNIILNSQQSTTLEDQLHMYTNRKLASLNTNICEQVK